LLSTSTIYATNGCALQGKQYFLKKGYPYQKACTLPNEGSYRFLFKRFTHRRLGTHPSRLLIFDCRLRIQIAQWKPGFFCAVLSGGRFGGVGEMLTAPGLAIEQFIQHAGDFAITGGGDELLTVWI
jgi:hypothetical protein